MTLPTSGALSINAIAAEFGGSVPHAINEYYAGGGLVPSGATGTNGAVPSSGQIDFAKFYGTSAEDLIPNALNWTDVFYTDSLAAASASTNSQTISGLSTSITLAFDYDLSGEDYGGLIRFVVWKNGTVQSNTSVDRAVGSGSFSSISVSNSDSVYFEIKKLGFNPEEIGIINLTVKNQSQSNTTLDTCSLSISRE